jgi:uncharacterized protein (TIGR02145 family)
MNNKTQLLTIAFIVFALHASAQVKGTFTDPRDGKLYKTVKIGTQTWMAENLKVMKFNDGTPLPQIRDKGAWGKTKTPAYGWYKDDINYRETYGAIYNWFAVGTGKLCPVGWHVPTKEEWIDLMDYAGGSDYSQDNPAKLKEAGTAHWKAPNTGATNELFFTALPAGEVTITDSDAEPGTRTSWWTSTEDSIDPKSNEYAANAIIVGLIYNFETENLGSYQKESALPVRCKMDKE